MPELPEVETIRRDLEREVVGRKIRSVDVHEMRSIRRHPHKKHFSSKLEGRKLVSLRRRGKYLLFDLGDDEVLVVHLGMSGQLRKVPTSAEMAPNTRVVITFTQGGQLRFIDPRMFGEMFVTAADTLTDEVPELAELGFDPLEEPIPWVEFAARLQGRRAKLKTLLLDQRFIAGLGNIYADEILFEAGLRYDRRSDTLSSQEVRRLYRAIVEVLHDAIKHRGSTLADAQYVDLEGSHGSYQDLHRVYGRDGQPCPRCRHVIEKVKFSGRSSWYCPQCQV